MFEFDFVRVRTRGIGSMSDGILQLFLRSTPESSGSGEGRGLETNQTHHDGAHGNHGRGTVLFLFAAFAVGALVRHVLKRTPIPYTVILIVLGLAFGVASNAEALSILHDYTGLARMDPHLMLFVFLPTLIFESAFVMEVHTFRKTIAQTMLLAGPGLILCTFLTALIARYIFTYNWSWVTALMFGSIMSATDPVAVVALLKDLGASKQLGTIIEGESLLNDGAAIVLFNVLLYELIPGQSQTALQIFVYFIRVAFGGPAFGYIMAKLTIFWLSHVFNDALVEITITLASTYITFYIGEGILGVSGVLAVVTLGIEINSRRTNISPEVEVFLHRFWGMLGYLANTLIFILVGVVIAQRAFSGVESIDWMFMVALYIGIMVIRLLVIGMLTPILTHIGYRLDWKLATVITWGGLRGAVGLSLALVVAQTSGVPLDTIGSKVLFHTAGIVILTLLLNATTVKYLLQALGMSDISMASRLTMATAVKRVREAQMRAIGMLKSDRFLADSDWVIVERKTEINDPYSQQDEELELAENGVVAVSGVHSQCPKCETEVPRVPHPKELAELAEEVRLRMIKAEKTSYWRQFEQGMLGRDAVLVLVNLADSVVDTPERLIVAKDIAPYWKIPLILNKIRQWIVASINWKSSDEIPAPSVRCCNGPYKLVTHTLFEWTLFAVIIVNIVCTIVELSISSDSVGQTVLEYFNYVFVTTYIVEAILKIVGLRQYYFYSKWNIFDFFILLVSLVDIIVELSLPESTSSFSPAVLRIIRVFRILRVGRGLRLVKFVLPLVIHLVDAIINRRLRFGYDIGKGFVVGEEEMLQQFDRIGSVVHKSIAQELRRRAESTRLDVIRSLGLMRKDHPGVALSVKTHQAIRSVLNHCRDTIKQLLGGGLLDENDAEKLFRAIEVKMKHLERTPSSLPPPNPNVILCNLPWLSGLCVEVRDTIHDHAELVQFEHGDVVIEQGDISKGIYIIVSGLVKVTIYKQMEPSEHKPSPDESTHDGTKKNDAPSSSSPLPPPLPPPSSSTQDNGSTIDFFGAGSVMGEMGVLKQKHCNATVECETAVQAFFLAEKQLQNIMLQYPVVEERLWKVCGIRIATQLLTQLPEYQDWPTSKLLLLCEGAYIVSPPEGPVPTFEILKEHKEVVLVTGEVRCITTREKFSAPYIVPRNVRYLLMNTGTPKLLVIPAEVARSDGPESTSSQDRVLFYRRKQRGLQKRVIHTCRTIWHLLVQIPSLMAAVRQYCRRCTPCQRSNSVTPQEEEDQENMVEMEGGDPATNSARRVLTPVSPFREAEREAN